MFAHPDSGDLDRGVVLGIDPGLTRCGYAVLSARSPGEVRAMSLGVIRTPATDDVASRLAELYREIVSLVTTFRPAAVAVEQVFFQTNVRTAMSVGQASGVILAVAASAGCRVVQYTPSQVKNAVAGWGGADKAQVGTMVQRRLGLSEIPRPADAADAAAIALCHCAIVPFMDRRDEAVARAVTR